jgi:hypothetical protein
LATPLPPARRCHGCGLPISLIAPNVQPFGPGGFAKSFDDLFFSIKDAGHDVTSARTDDARAAR